MKHTRIVSLILALAGIALLILGLAVPVFLQDGAPEPSVGIIGGADGPTYLLTLKAAAGGLFLWLAVIGALLTVASIVVLMIGKKKKH